MTINETNACREIRPRKHAYIETEEQQQMLKTIDLKVAAPRECIEQDVYLQELKQLVSIHREDVARNVFLTQK